MYGDWGWGMGFGFGHWIFGVLFWIVLIVLAVLLVRSLSGGSRENRTERGERRAVDILKERYARGEINADEFQRKKEDLER